MKIEARGQRLGRALAFAAPFVALLLIGRGSPAQSPVASDSQAAMSDAGDVLSRRDGGTYCGDGGSGFDTGCIAVLGNLHIAGPLIFMDGGSLNPDGGLLPDGGNPLNGIQVSTYCILYSGQCAGEQLFSSEWSTPATPGANGWVEVEMPSALTTAINCTCPKSIWCSVKTSGKCGPDQYNTFCRPLNDPDHLTPDLSPLQSDPIWLSCPALEAAASTAD